MGEEHRRHARKKLDASFRAREAEGAGELVFTAADLSAGGSFLKAELLLEQGERLSLEFRVPGVPRLLKAQARVAWVRRFPNEGEAPGMGMEFLSMSDEDQGVLARYLERVEG